MDSNEILFWKIIHNKYLFNYILNLLSYDFTHKYGNVILHHSVDWLIENGYKKTLKHKILNNHYLVFGVDFDLFYQDKLGKIFKFFNKDPDTHGNNKEFYKTLLKRCNSHLCMNPNSKAMIATAVYNLKALQVICEYYGYVPTIEVLYQSIETRHFKVTRWILETFYHKIKSNSTALTNNIELEVWEKLKNTIIEKISLSYRKFNRYYRLIIFLVETLHFESPIDHLNKIISSTSTTSVPVSVPGSVPVSVPITATPSTPSTSSTLNIEQQNYLNSTKRRFNLLYNVCPFELNFKISWLLNACLSIVSLNLIYNHDFSDNSNNSSQGCMNCNNCISSENSSDGLNNDNNQNTTSNDSATSKSRLTFILTKKELESMKFTKEELKSRILEIDENHQNAKKLVQMYLATKEKRNNTKCSMYWLKYGNDNFQNIDQINSFWSADTNAFKYGSHILLRKWFHSQNSIPQPFLDLLAKVNQVVEQQSIDNQRINLLFEHCQDRNRQIEFIKQISNDINDESCSITHKLHPLFFLSLVVSYDDLELVKLAFNLLKKSFKRLNRNNQQKQDQDQEETSSEHPKKKQKIDNDNNNNNNNNSYFECFINLSEYKDKELNIFYTQYFNESKLSNIYQYVQSLPVLEFICQYFDCTINCELKSWFLKGRIDLLERYEKIVQSKTSNKIPFPIMYISWQLDDQRFSQYLECTRYVVSKQDRYNLVPGSLSFINNFEKKMTPKDIENLKYIIENYQDLVYYPFDSSHNHCRNNLTEAHIEFFKWVLETRHQDFSSGRCHLSFQEYKLLLYYTGNHNQLFSEFGNNQLIHPSQFSSPPSQESKSISIVDFFYESDIWLQKVGENGNIDIIEKIIQTFFLKETVESKFYLLVLQSIINTSLDFGHTKVFNYLYKNYPQFLPFNYGFNQNQKYSVLNNNIYNQLNNNNINNNNINNNNNNNNNLQEMLNDSFQSQQFQLQFQPQQLTPQLQHKFFNDQLFNK
ncbi:hypothetical protein DICPUDRAFT_84633 [Dictyostelium purpureum]|uniref:Uncharacterized protein n=1 Tax=Dictyostelium purpureum TaxID=5786 RepID=F1A392_DICPU|nr:uncharacterized protein DICPUDRAFT_84633 [Dictyostelium purpureum]EGC29333.1 hypothetical protein DICPUDRAFT_84633 [Dictyostelium purpureum]|eukprot:XP_003294136.1 hypothetical protein DICPUDRAFT_84633 [Dictyostelium purpureum]